MGYASLRAQGDALLNVGKHAEAIAVYEKAYALEPKDAGLLNNFAWVLATSPEAKLRDGDKALELATQACELTDYKLPHILSTLAAAYAETGDFENARKWIDKALEIGDQEHDDGDQEVPAVPVHASILSEPRTIVRTGPEDPEGRPNTGIRCQVRIPRVRGQPSRSFIGRSSASAIHRRKRAASAPSITRWS